jgi:hypothetical protein
MADIRDENGRKERLYLFYDGESVSGKVNWVKPSFLVSLDYLILNQALVFIFNLSSQSFDYVPYSYTD